MSRVMVNSNVEWIGTIPEKWNIVPLRYATIEINEKNNPIKFTNVLSLTNTLGVVPYEEKGSQGNISKEDLTQYKIAYKDTIIINSMNLKIGSVGLSKYEGCVSPVYYVLKAKHNYDINYINYLFQSEFQKFLGKYGKGILEIREKISMYDVLRSYIPSPSYDEQVRISKYLDKKISNIESIIRDNKKEIELLEEYKISYIDSCINNFDKIKMKKLSESIGDGLHGTPEYSEDGEYYFVNGNNIGEEYLSFKDSTDRISKEEYLKYKEKNINNHTILITLNGATYGKTSFYNGEKVFLGKSAGFITLKENVNKQYIRLFLMSSLAKRQFDLSLAGSTIANLSLETLNNLIVPLPDEETQKDVSNKILKEINLINKCIDYRKRIIDKLDEYKKALIYETVTGKKEV